MNPATQSTAVEPSVLAGGLSPGTLGLPRVKARPGAARRRPPAVVPGLNPCPSPRVCVHRLHGELRTLTAAYLNPNASLRLRAEGSWIYLTGEVDWYYQKVEIERLIRSAPGVLGLTSGLVILGLPRPSTDAA